MHKEQILVISLDNKFGQGEDFQIVEDYEQAVVIGVFDGLGGRSVGTAEEKGGRIASRKAAEITKDILTESQGNLDQDRALEIKVKTCQMLKEFAEKNLPVSRIRGKLASKRLCSTIGVASLFKKLTDDQKYLVQIAWMGDSRIYYLQPHQGLKQLTKDDLKESKDALEVIYQDLPMSKFLTADPEIDWEINYKAFELPEEGFILACTDGCFQYLPAPWEFEKLLLKTLIESNSMEEWQSLLTNFYKNNKYDDVTLLLCSLGKDKLEFKDFHTAYKPRLDHLYKNYYIHNKSSSDELKKMWGQYRNNYENLLEEAKFEDFADAKEVKANDVYLSNLEEKTEPIETFEGESSSYLTEEEIEPTETFEGESSSYLIEEEIEPTETFEGESSSYLIEEEIEPTE
ncbi:MAG: protein phosphatase 2C domain-containing protein, partial [Trichodesmium sp. MAG_R04]|nr:protein phosphatase 2C domain-containing protein [Trichodesmium sp. MAG_R04]